ncbi:RagB/SusD family nutrient uptake outer membrane protein [Pedobacter miscanthi]|uniref:RagB/SusD family nutrient uptake outer membrane protein n=1 Tax=Pedobacter miscanthi TaxID=2259170 RepID=UPI00292ECBA4|nr:RagB/SusD family nutrient uptake outer membrane protein [Pedobacter miscanthi]
MKIHNINNIKLIRSFFFIGLLSLLSTSGCKKFLEIPLPASSIANEAAYSTDRSSAATINNILGNLSNNAMFDGTGIAYKSGLYTDELQNLNSASAVNQPYYTNLLQPADAGQLWIQLYKQIYNANLAIEGITASETLNRKNQWLGEAYFLRAYLYFYLVNLYGDVPLSLTSDFLISNRLPRSPRAQVYQSIVSDLTQAQSLLTPEYRDGAGAITTLKGRPNKFTAQSLLARVYLYTGEWAKAEEQATAVIANTAYILLPAVDIDKVFLAASAETIFALVPVGVSPEKDYLVYTNTMPATIPATSSFLTYGVNASMSPSLYGSFEVNPVTGADDRRKTFWTRTSIRPATPPASAETGYFPFKYKSLVSGTEYIILFRLAEQFLIRSEARARLNNLDGAKSDLNRIRDRAGLSPTSASTQGDLLSAVMQERRIELFSECGHRFFDLKRTASIDAVMSAEVALKGGGIVWNGNKALWPINSDDIRANPAIVQNPGY